MTRAAVGVRAANADDVPTLVTLWTATQERAPRRHRALLAESGTPLDVRLAAAMVDPDCRLVVAVDGEQVIGMCLLRLVAASLLYDSRVIEISGMCVADGQRRRGAGKTLVAAAISYADELDVDSVSVGVLPAQRDTNRFYARLGFAPLTVRRVAATASLRRHLGLGDTRAALLRRYAKRPIGSAFRGHDGERVRHTRRESRIGSGDG